MDMVMELEDRFDVYSHERRGEIQTVDELADTVLKLSPGASPPWACRPPCRSARRLS
jgi:hypothetical protein